MNIINLHNQINGNLSENVKERKGLHSIIANQPGLKSADAFSNILSDQISDTSKIPGKPIMINQDPNNIVFGQLRARKIQDTPRGDLQIQMFQSEPGMTSRDIVMGMASVNRHIEARLMNSFDVEEKREIAIEYKLAVLEALRMAGKDVQDTDSADKLIIEGETVDLIYALGTPGGESRFHWHVCRPGEGYDAFDDNQKLIMSMGDRYVHLLSQINQSNNGDERRAIAREIKALLINDLRDMGIEVEDTQSPDKVIIDGITYDFIMHLNSDGPAYWVTNISH